MSLIMPEFALFQRSCKLQVRSEMNMPDWPRGQNFWPLPNDISFGFDLQAKIFV